ncbi:MAG: ChbG/HpnK family deacetylase [Patescibacteria group bacterium]
MRRLIVNADDLGISAPRTHGIFQCMEEGVVRSATLIVNMPDSLNAARRLNERSIPAGLHINLTEGSALTPEQDVHSLLDARGYFMGRDRLDQAFDEGVVEKEHLEREIRTQIEWFLDNADAPTHCDSHHHIHVHPQVAPLLGPILNRYGISAIRVPLEIMERMAWEITPERTAYIERIHEQARKAKPIFESADLRTTDHFRGLALLGEAGAKRLRSLLTALPEGTTELMVHPGACDPLGDDFSRDPQRETERNMLLDPELPGMLRSRGIELMGYGDL